MMDKPKCVCVCGCPDALAWRKAIEDRAAEALHRIVGAPKAAAA